MAEQTYQPKLDPQGLLDGYVGRDPVAQGLLEGYVGSNSAPQKTK